MRVQFRPLPGFTLFCAPLFALLVGLGIWQLERLQWKLALIAQITRNMDAVPISLDEALVRGDRAQYRRVVLNGAFRNPSETYVYTTGPHGGAVYHVLTPFRLADGREVMVDRGFIPVTLRDPATRPGSETQGQTNLVGIWRLPDKPGPFTPRPDLAHRVWFVRDVIGIARSEHLKLAAPDVVEAVAAPNVRGWPRGGQTRIDIPNDHLQYALTWFLLAAALLAIYLAYHRARGRLVMLADKRAR